MLRFIEFGSDLGLGSSRASIFVRNRAEMGGGQCGFLQFQRRGFEVEAGRVRAEQDALGGDVFEHAFNAADAFEHGDFDVDFAGVEQADTVCRCAMRWPAH